MYYALVPNPKNKSCVGKILFRHGCLKMAQAHIKRAQKDYEPKLILVSSDVNKTKNQNMNASEIKEYL